MTPCAIEHSTEMKMSNLCNGVANLNTSKNPTSFLASEAGVCSKMILEKKERKERKKKIICKPQARL